MAAGAATAGVAEAAHAGDMAAVVDGTAGTRAFTFSGFALWLVVPAANLRFRVCLHNPVGRHYGALGRTRTFTLSGTRPFGRITSANSATSANQCREYHWISQHGILRHQHNLPDAALFSLTVGLRSFRNRHDPLHRQLELAVTDGFRIVA
jgi:hypothetical protein